MDSQFQRKKILICGGSSLLTYLWCNSITNDFEILITRNKRKIDYLKIPSIKVDLLSSDSIIRAITENSIDIVINTVGLTNVEQCEFFLWVEPFCSLCETFTAYVADPNIALSITAKAFNVCYSCKTFSS